MTAPDYVAQVADVIREFIVEAVGFDNGELMTAQAEHLARNLAAAGLIPASTEWGVRHSQGLVVEPSERFARDKAKDISARDARRRLAARGLTAVVSRAATDWKDAT